MENVEIRTMSSLQMFSNHEAVLYTLLAVAKCHKKPYCYPSQGYICKLVKDFYKIDISRRTLNRILKKMEQSRLIERIRRHREGSDGKILFSTTLYKFKGKAFNFLIALDKRMKDLFGFFRVPKWAKYRTPKSLGFGSLMGVGGDSRLLEREKVGPPGVKDILFRLPPVS